MLFMAIKLLVHLLAEAASWDLVEIKKSAAVAEEAAVGLNWTLSDGIFHA
jgi:hypothetical protein